MERISHFIVHRPKSILCFLVLLTGFFAFHARRIRIDSSVEYLLATNDPNQQYYAEMRALFGSDTIGVIGLVTENVYTPAALEKLQRITAQVEQVEGLERVLSLTNFPDMLANVIEPPLLIPQIPSDSAALVALRQEVEANPIYTHFASRDGQAAAIVLWFKNLGDDEVINARIDDRLQDILAREQGPEHLYLAGLQNVKVNLLKLMRQDLRTFTPLSLAVIMTVLGFCFRSLRGVALPLLSVLCGVVWILGIMALAGTPLTIGTLVLPSLLIVIGSTYSIYVLAQYEEEAEKGGAVTAVVGQALSRVSLPVLVAVFTTVVGFATLLVNRIGTIRALGLYAAVGFAGVAVIVLTLIPALLVLLPLPRPRKTGKRAHKLAAFLAWMGHFDRRYQVPIMVVATLVVLPCLWGVLRIRADSNFLQFFTKDSAVRRANEIISEKLGGAQSFYVVINSGTKGGATSWDLLRRIKALQLHLASLPGIDQTLSLVDYCELFDTAIQHGGPSNDALAGETGEAAPLPVASVTAPLATLWEQPEQSEAPTQLKAVLQVVSMIPKSFASLVVSPDFSTANIVVRTRLTSSRDIERTADDVRSYAKEHFPPEVTVRPTGSLILLNEATEDLVWGQVKSLGIALAVIFVILSLMFLSAKVGLLALLPNLLAMVIFFGAMGWAGVTLNLGTSIIASIAIGIAVEDAIRYLARLSAEVRATHDQERAIFHTITTVGKPILYASAALGLGFLTFLFSHFVPIQELGMLTAITIAAAFVNDLVLLPALLATTRIITLWDLLALKLGKDPHKTIGLFAGLRPSQAKIVTLMGQLRTFPCGHPIVRQGEVGDEMYVLIGGMAEVRVTVNGQSRVVRHLQRGDVFGEMGLIRRHQRTADVIAAEEEVEVLAVNERFLTRMQRRYPRIGARIFLNLAKVLSDRLEEETSHRATR
jgi:uncharacterized protein